MKKLVTALIIVLPLLLAIALFAVTGFTRLATNVAATGIKINNAGDDGNYTFYMDLANYSASNALFERDLGVEVLPKIATNRKFSRQIASEDGEQTDIVTCDENGMFVPHGIGNAKVTYTSVDGNFKAGIMIVVTSSDVISFEPTLSDVNGKSYELIKNNDGNYAANIPSGSYTLGAKSYPDIAPSSINFASEDDVALGIDSVSGRFDARLSGKTTVTMAVGKAESKTIELNVAKSGDVTVNGLDISSSPHFSAPLNSASLKMYVETDPHIAVEELEIGKHAYVMGYKFTPISGREGAFVLDLNLTSPFTSVTEDVRFSLIVGGVSHPLILDFADYSVFIHSASNPFGSEELILREDESLRFAISAAPSAPSLPDGMTFEWSLDGDCAQIISSADKYADIKAVGVGEARLRVYWQYNGSSGTEEMPIRVIKTYTSLVFGEAAQNYGLGELAIASNRYDDELNFTSSPYKANFIAKNKAGGNSSDLEDIEFSLSDGTYAAVRTEGARVNIDIFHTGHITLTASWKYGERYGVNPATLTCTVVDGVRIGSANSPIDEFTAYLQLRKATQEGRQIVLEQDVRLGESLYERTADNSDYLLDSGLKRAKYDDATMRQKLSAYTSELYTTADWTYYKNRGEEHPQIRYALEFSNNVYGNGHSVSGEYITNHIDSYGQLYDYALFRGPLNFVAAALGAEDILSVKGQDNIVFLIRNDNVTLDNIVLMGCDDATLIGGDNLYLDALDNIGTTLEIMANAEIKNCRIRNGRTVVRAFGRYDVNADSPVDTAAEKISVTLDRCHLQNSREFLLKIGTNRFIRGSVGGDDDNAPDLCHAGGTPYSGHNDDACDEYINDRYFMDNLVLTDITLKDSLLQNSGLFCIGVESHFSGELLADAANSSDPTFSALAASLLVGWKDLAATSYPSALHLVGKVIMADWKDIDSVNSDTLIEVGQSEGLQELGKMFALNIGAMLREVAKNEDYADILSDNGGTQYAHGGIAFYGGGKNYGVLDCSKFDFEPLNTYCVNLSVLTHAEDTTLQNQGNLLPHAAGINDFRFAMYGSASKFGPGTQNEYIDNFFE